MLKKASSPLPSVPKAVTGPLYGMVWPILISMAVTPGAFSAAAGPAVAPSVNSAALANSNVSFAILAFPRY
jgi:hypothetical protein